MFLREKKLHLWLVNVSNKVNDARETRRQIRMDLSI